MLNFEGVDLCCGISLWKAVFRVDVEAVFLVE